MHWYNHWSFSICFLTHPPANIPFKSVTHVHNYFSLNKHPFSVDKVHSNGRTMYTISFSAVLRLWELLRSYRSGCCFASLAKCLQAWSWMYVVNRKPDGVVLYQRDATHVFSIEKQSYKWKSLNCTIRSDSFQLLMPIK